MPASPSPGVDSPDGPCPHATRRDARAAYVHGSHATGCYKYDHDAKLKEEDFPSDHYREALENATKKDARDGHGNVYYTHNKICTAGHPWKGFDWHDDAFDAAYHDLERSLFGERRAYVAVAPLVGISAATQVELAAGLREPLALRFKGGGR